MAQDNAPIDNEKNSQPMEGESPERFAERIELESKLEILNRQAGPVFESIGMVAFDLACKDDSLADRLGDAFSAAMQQLAERKEVVDRLDQLEEKRLQKIEDMRKFEEAEAAKAEIEEESMRLEEETRLAVEEAQRLAKEAQERADALNAMLEESRRKREKADEELEKAREAAQYTMCLDLLDSSAETADDTQDKSGVDLEDTLEPELCDSDSPKFSEDGIITCDFAISDFDQTPSCADPAETPAPEPFAVAGSDAKQAPAEASVPADPGYTICASEVTPSPAVEAIAAAPVSPAVDETPRCPNCNSAVGQDDAFCMECGTSLKLAVPASPQPAAPAVPAVKMCPECGNVANPGDAFCMMCGHRL